MSLKYRYLTSLVLSFFLLTSLSANAENLRTLHWDDLLPPADLEALINPPEYLNEIDDGSLADQITNGLEQALTLADDDAYQQALVSTNVVAEMDGQRVRVPGFIVPLSYDSEQRVKTFFLVPYFGACIHVPPPPPNQIIYGELEQGSVVADIYDAYWVTGTLHTTITENDTATSAYRLTVTGVSLYDDDPSYPD
jgi:hypothetical protein